MSKSPAVIVAKDTDVFLLLACAVRYQNNPPHWSMKIDANQLEGTFAVFFNRYAITGSNTIA